MLSDESSSDSETGRFKCQAKTQDSKGNSHQKSENSFNISARNRRNDDRLNRGSDRRRDERDRFDRRSRERHRHPKYSPIRRRPSRDNTRTRRSPEKYRDRYRQDFRSRSKQKETRSSSRERYRCSRSKSHKSPVKTRNLKDEIKDIISKDKIPDKNDKKAIQVKSSSPEFTVKKSAIHKPSPTETIKKNSDSPILIHENGDSDTPDVVQAGSYYNMIPAIVGKPTDSKENPEVSSEIDSSDDERLRAKLLNLEKELQKTKKRKHKKRHKRKSVKPDKDKLKGDDISSASVEVSSTTDIQDTKCDAASNATESAEVTSTQKNNQRDSNEEGEILSDDNSQSDIDPNDLRHKLKRRTDVQDKAQKLDICGPALPPHLEKRYKKSSSPQSEGPVLSPHLSNKSRNIGPSIPDDMRKVLAENTEVIYESSDDDGIGPLPAGAEAKWSDAHQQLEERAMEIKIKSLDGQSLQSSNIKTREKWMLELPEGKARFIGLEARSFRAKEGPDMSDRSSWTDTPEEKARKALGIAKEEDASESLQKEARTRIIANRDDDQEKAVKKHKKKHKREESLLEIHQKKLKKKKKKEDKDDDKKERPPFSRDVDLQVNRFDEAQKKSIIKKAQGLNTRFSSGEAKYL